MSEAGKPQDEVDLPGRRESQPPKDGDIKEGSSNAHIATQPVEGLSLDAERFRIEKGLNLVSILALLLALASTTWQVIGYLRGSETSLLYPETVEVRVDRDYLTVYSQMSYANQGRAGYNDIVSAERVKVEVGSHEIELNWKYFVKTDYINNKVVIDSDAGPVVVPGSGAVSHQTSFFARSQYGEGVEKWANYLKWEDFLVAVDDEESVRFTFTANVLGDASLQIACDMPIDDRARSYLRNNGVFTRTCVPVAQ